jgi:hypothetical protein
MSAIELFALVECLSGLKVDPRTGFLNRNPTDLRAIRAGTDFGTALARSVARGRPGPARSAD